MSEPKTYRMNKSYTEAEITMMIRALQHRANAVADIKERRTIFNLTNKLHEEVE